MKNKFSVDIINDTTGELFNVDLKEIMVHEMLDELHFTLNAAKRKKTDEISVQINNNIYDFANAETYLINNWR